MGLDRQPTVCHKLAMLLRDWITEKGLTAEQAAERFGCSISCISLWASGKRRPGIANTAAIAAATDDKVTAVDHQIVGEELLDRRVRRRIRMAARRR